ncbi:hypothetical protein BZA05DRAFT_449338 [Tricharina praecox]|uniref:uncharacterized protein n=1 Tax=Tricharina praecox TaxID=43433 RepID=UPI00221FFF00|nr:uncharacterized protein BZA05DRAFT_449338 [Tricharina praecox]KAI5842040.1 hypothetical protein BZA05DRAFT_449338 [Tricharina praecox]
MPDTPTDTLTTTSMEILTTMPAEILVEIFINLDTITDAVSLSRTCQLLHQVFENNSLALHRSTVPNDSLFVSYDRLQSSWSLYDAALRLHGVRHGGDCYWLQEDHTYGILRSCEEYAEVLSTAVGISTAAEKIWTLLVNRRLGNRSYDSVWCEFGIQAIKDLLYEYFACLEDYGIKYVTHFQTLAAIAWVVWRHWKESWGIPGMTETSKRTFSAWTYSLPGINHYAEVEHRIITQYVDWLTFHSGWDWWKSLEGSWRTAERPDVNFGSLYCRTLMFAVNDHEE